MAVLSALVPEVGSAASLSLPLSTTFLSLLFADQSQTSLLPVTNIKAKSRGITGKATSYTKWPKTPDRSQSFGSPNASPSSPFTHIQGKSKYISNLSLSRSNSPLGQARQQRSIKQPVSEWPRTEDPGTDGRWTLSSFLPAAAPWSWVLSWGILNHLGLICPAQLSLCPHPAACLPPALPVQPDSTSSPALHTPCCPTLSGRISQLLVPFCGCCTGISILTPISACSAISKSDLEEEMHRFSHAGSREKGVSMTSLWHSLGRPFSWLSVAGRGVSAVLQQSDPLSDDRVMRKGGLSARRPFQPFSLGLHQLPSLCCP